MPKQNPNAQAILNVLSQMAQATPRAVQVGKKKMGRPRKKKVSELNDASIMPVANGYIVQSTSTAGEVYVFEDIDKAFDFIKSSLKPTGEQAEFLNKV